MCRDIFGISLDKVQDLRYFMRMEVKDITLSISVTNQKIKRVNVFSWFKFS